MRIRLNSTVVNAHHVGERAKANAVEVKYVRDGQAHRVRGGTCVMACYNSVIPYLCPDLPEDQKEHLHMAVRRPFVVANVVVRDWRAFERLGVASMPSEVVVVVQDQDASFRHRLPEVVGRSETTQPSTHHDQVMAPLFVLDPGG